MIVFTLNTGKAIRIDDEIQIEVFGTNGDKVTLGFEAPSHVKIYRAELYLQNADKRGNTLK
ncbi:carbon storage regulator [Pseudomonas sp. Tn43]|uniref:carbon storage regulator n=1 Tax=Pseudomonas sp. Tn43 TaxID=701213 RepID=UPI001615E5A6|nr:carbon storage regulator [Pseudomonas sp. Tn43]